MLKKKYNMLEQWIRANKNGINSYKTHLIVMGSKKHRNTRMGVSVNASGHIITHTETEKTSRGTAASVTNLEFSTQKITRGH